jgi:hypothetical protein
MPAGDVGENDGVAAETGIECYEVDRLLCSEEPRAKSLDVEEVRYRETPTGLPILRRR